MVYRVGVSVGTDDFAECAGGASSPPCLRLHPALPAGWPGLWDAEDAGYCPIQPTPIHLCWRTGRHESGTGRSTSVSHPWFGYTHKYVHARRGFLIHEHSDYTKLNLHVLKWAAHREISNPLPFVKGRVPFQKENALCVFRLMSLLR